MVRDLAIQISLKLVLGSFDISYFNLGVLSGVRCFRLILYFSYPTIAVISKAISSGSHGSF